MAYDDEKLGRLFPTRTGDATGTANERKMLDALAGSDSIRTKTQRFEEGKKVTTTRLRTRAGNPEFITEITDDDDEQEEIYMDTGAVDLLSIAPDNPLSGESAPLYYGTIQRTYYDLKKLLGKLIPPSLKSRKPPVEGVAGKSFKKKEGADLIGKKECAAKCPPSMFTGKARLYAQAQYGRALKDWKWTLDIPLGLSPRLQHDNGSVINTNSGIYTDAEYKHWLVTIHPGGALITKMVRDDKVKPLVRHLRNPDKAADWKKIEAYILAYSTPSEDVNFNIDIPGAPAPQMLGYGWKFNWLGDKADIIEHSEGAPTHRSTHFRLTIKRDTTRYIPSNVPALEAEKQRWSVALSTVEGPVTWHNSRYNQVIAHPEWLFNNLWIFGTSGGGSDCVGIPVYCFYRDDNVLEVFRYSFTGKTSQIKYQRTATPSTWGIVCDWTADASIGMNTTPYDGYGTFGTDGGEGERRRRLYTPEITGFACSYANTVSSYQSYTYEKRALGGKTLGPTGYGYPSTNFSPTGIVDIPQNAYTASPLTLSDGVISQIGGNEITFDTFGTGPGDFTASFTMDCLQYGLSYEEGSHVETNYSLLLIPFYDAEAAYVHGNKNTTRTASGWDNGSISGSTGVWGSILQKYVTTGGVTSLVGEWYQYRAHSGSWGTPTSKTDFSGRVASHDQELAAKLVTRSGGYAFSPPMSLGPFFAGTPMVEQQFNTHSASVGAAAYGHGAKNLEGFPDRFESPPPFIGWA